MANKSENHIPFDLDSLEPWYRRPERILLYCGLLPAALITPTAVGFDQSMTNALQTIPYFQEEFNHPSGLSLGFYGAAQSLGGVIAMAVGPWAADLLGRRAPIAIGSLLVVGSTFGQVWALNFAMFNIFKVTLGIGIAMTQLGAPVLVAELSHPKERVQVTNLYNTSIFLGMLVGSWIAFGTVNIPSAWSWKLPCLLQVVCSTYQMFFIYLCPESPRWYVAKGKTEKARQILNKYHAAGRPNDSLVEWELGEMTQAIEMEKSINTSFREVVTDKGFLRRAFLCICCGVFSQTSGNGLVSAYLVQILHGAGITDVKTVTLINGCSSIWSWIVGIACALLTPKLKRRFTFLVGTTGMLLTFVGWTVAQARYEITGNQSAGFVVLAFIFLYNATYAFAWLYLVITYPVEISNYRFRARLWALTMLSISLSGFFNQFVNPIGLEDAGWRYYIYYDVWVLIELGVIYFFFPETSGLSLEEVAAVLDGEKAPVVADEKLAVGQDVVHKE